MTPGIAGIGLVGGFGAGREAFLETLVRGKSAPESVSVAGTAVSALRADLAPLNRFHSQRQLRRIERFSQLALLGCRLALEDAAIPLPLQHRMGLIVATGWGPTPDRFDFDDCGDDSETPLFSPMKFANSVQNAPAAHISIFLEMDGPTLTVNDHLLSFPTALLTARQWLREDRVDAVLVGGVDEACLSQGLWRRRSGDMDAGVCGEGSAFFLLDGNSDNAPYGVLSDVGMGRFPTSDPKFPENPVIFPEGVEAPNGLTGDADVVRYQSLYGEFPVGTAFTVAAAGLSIRTGTVYTPSAGGRQETPLNDRKIICLTHGVDDTWATVTLSPS